jgi:hypothetical protein
MWHGQMINIRDGVKLYEQIMEVLEKKERKEEEEEIMEEHDRFGLHSTSAREKVINKSHYGFSIS